MLAQARRRALGCHWPSADDDRRPQAGNFSALGARVGEFEPHAAMDHLRIGKHLIEIVDRPGALARPRPPLPFDAGMEQREQLNEILDQPGWGFDEVGSPDDGQLLGIDDDDEDGSSTVTYEYRQDYIDKLFTPPSQVFDT